MKTIFINKYGEVRSGWAILLSLLILSVVPEVISNTVLAIMRTAAAQGNKALLNIIMHIVSGQGFYYLLYTILIALVLLLFKLLYKRPLWQMGFYKQNWAKDLLLGGLFGIVSISILFAILVATGNAIVAEVNTNYLFQIDFLYDFLFFVFVGFFEEVLSRGFMMTALKTTRNKWVILLVPSVIFGALHATNPNVTLLSLTNIALVGILFALLLIKTGKLWAPIGYHITWNFVQGNIFGVAVSGTQTNSLMRTTFAGSDLLTGGAFGIEGGILCTVVILASILLLHFFVKDPTPPCWALESDLPLTRGNKALPNAPVANNNL